MSILKSMAVSKGELQVTLEQGEEGRLGFFIRQVRHHAFPHIARSDHSISVRESRRMAIFFNRHADKIAKHNHRFNWKLQGAKVKRKPKAKQIEVFEVDGGTNG